jgi:hypothetical protein
MRWRADVGVVPSRNFGEYTALNPLQWSRKFPLRRTFAARFVPVKALLKAVAVKSEALAVIDPVDVLLTAGQLVPVPPINVDPAMLIDPVEALFKPGLLLVLPPVTVQADMLTIPVAELLLIADPAEPEPPVKVELLTVIVPEEEFCTAWLAEWPAVRVELLTATVPLEVLLIANATVDEVAEPLRVAPF